MTDDDRALHSKPGQRLRDERRLPRGRGIGVARRPRAPTVARAIDENHAMRRRELLAKRKTHIFHVSARAMDQNDGGLGAGSATREAKLGHVKPRALDLQELASRRV